MYTMRNLVDDAYHESGVVGNGMTMQADQLGDGIRSLNFILDNIHALNMQTYTASVTVNFTGLKSYTLGTAPVLITDPTPDIIVPTSPNMIDGVYVFTGGVRYTIPPVDPETYFSATNILTQPYPSGYYYQCSDPIGTLYFVDGQPSGQGTITYKHSLSEVTPNTDYAQFPRELRPYLVYELAAKVALSNTFDNTSLKMQANNYWQAYQNSCYQGQKYMADTSAPGFAGNSKYNIYAGN